MLLGRPRLLALSADSEAVDEWLDHLQRAEAEAGARGRAAILGVLKAGGR
jgi:hypothetical protein